MSSVAIESEDSIKRKLSQRKVKQWSKNTSARFVSGAWRTALKIPHITWNKPWPIDKPVVTVIVACYNYGKFLPHIVESLNNQTWTNFEVLLIDGGSTDPETPKIIKSLAGGKFKAVILKKRQTVNEDRLLGMQKARGKYCVFLDADDMLAPTYLEKAVYLMETRGSGLICPGARIFEIESELTQPLPIDKFWVTDGVPLREILQTNSCSVTSMFRRSFWAKKKPGIFIGTQIAEDWDFWIRLATKGIRYQVIQEPLHYYRVHGTSVTRSWSDVQWDEGLDNVRGRFTYFSKSRFKMAHAVWQQKRREITLNPFVNLLGKNQTRNTSLSKDVQPHVLIIVPFIDKEFYLSNVKKLANKLNRTGHKLTLVLTESRSLKAIDYSLTLPPYLKDRFDFKSMEPLDCFELACYLMLSRNTKKVYFADSKFIEQHLIDLKKLFPNQKYVKHFD